MPVPVRVIPGPRPFPEYNSARGANKAEELGKKMESFLSRSIRVDEELMGGPASHRRLGPIPSAQDGTYHNLLPIGRFVPAG